MDANDAFQRWQWPQLLTWWKRSSVARLPLLSRSNWSQCQGIVNEHSNPGEGVCEKIAGYWLKWRIINRLARFVMTTQTRRMESMTLRLLIRTTWNAAENLFGKSSHLIQISSGNWSCVIHMIIISYPVVIISEPVDMHSMCGSGTHR
jgi:hypothetical protein